MASQKCLASLAVLAALLVARAGAVGGPLPAPPPVTTTQSAQATQRPLTADYHSVLAAVHTPVHATSQQPDATTQHQRTSTMPTTTTTTDPTDSDSDSDAEPEEPPEEGGPMSEEARQKWCALRELLFQEAKQNPWNNLFYLLYLLLFVVGLSGNSLTVRAMTKKRRKSNVDLFILTLAINDILVCIFNIPITPIYTLYYQQWVFGSILCYVFTFAMCFSTYTSVFTLIAIAVVRYQMVVYPHCRWMTRRTVLYMIALVSLLGLSMTLPYMLNIKLNSDACNVAYCNESWDTIGGKLTFSLITLISKSVLPSLVVFLSYAAIYRKLKGRQRMHERRKALLTLAYPGAFPALANGTGGHEVPLSHPHLLKATTLPASNTVPYELNTAHQGLSEPADEPPLLRRVPNGCGLIGAGGANRNAESLQEPPPGYPLGVLGAGGFPVASEPLSLEAAVDKYHSASEMGAAQVFGSPFELSHLLGPRKNSADQQLAPVAGSTTTALVDGLVDRFVAQASAGSGRSSHQRPATSLGFLHKVVSATNLFRTEQQLAAAVAKTTAVNHQLKTPSSLKTNTILALREHQIRERNHRMYQASRKLVIVVALFVACYLPVDMINAIYDYRIYLNLTRGGEPFSQLNSYYFLATHLVNCASVCINPILYAWMSDNYRQELKNILPQWLVKRLLRLPAD